MAANLEIEFEGEVLGSGYYLGAEVKSADEVPLRSLIFQRGTATQDERLVRVATLDDLDLPETSAPHNLFRGSSLQTKDWSWPAPSGFVHSIACFFIDITHPEWVKLGAGSTVILDVEDILANDLVKVTMPFVAFGNQLYYQHLYHQIGVFPIFPNNVEYPQDGIADREYPDDPSIYYRTDSAFALLDSLDRAQSRKESLRAQAQSLVDAANETYPTYAGDDTYDYS